MPSRVVASRRARLCGVLLLLGTGTGGAAPEVAVWPEHLQPFFLSALALELTAEEASYIGAFPLAIINHKQGSRDASGQSAEAKQLKAIAAVKQANSSSRALFYLNSQIDFPELSLHAEAVAADGAWWLRDSEGGFVWHNHSAVRGDGEHVFDMSVAAAREAWGRTATLALKVADGVFVDKANALATFRGVSKAKMQKWRDGHAALLAALRQSTTKLVLLNNAHAAPAAGGSSGAGQLFERWGESPDHDGLNLKQDMALLGDLQSEGLITLARAGGVAPGSSPSANAAACGSGLAAFLLAQTKPSLGYFSCEPDFRSGVDPTQPKWNRSSGWMTLLGQQEYSLALGAPTGPAELHKSTGLTSRSFSSGAMAIVNASGDGCVVWAEGGYTTGICPQPAGGRKLCCTHCSVRCALRDCNKTELEDSAACNCGGSWVPSNHSWSHACDEMCGMSRFCHQCDHSC